MCLILIDDYVTKSYFIDTKFYLSICLSVCLSICLSVCLSVYLSVCLSLTHSLTQSLTLTLVVVRSTLVKEPESMLAHMFRDKGEDWTSV